MIIKAWKLFRLKPDGSLGSLFINRSADLPIGVWLKAKALKTKGFAFRPGWHCCQEPRAPHLKLVLKSGETRVWRNVLISDFQQQIRPRCQGGIWYIANNLKIEDLCETK